MSDDSAEPRAPAPSPGRVTLRLAVVKGTLIEVHPSLIIMLLLLVWATASQLLPAQEGPASYTALEFWILGAAASLLLFLSVVAHELSHVLAARLRGLKVERVTLFFHAGHSPHDDEARSPGEDLLIASVGPLTTAVLAVGAGLLTAALSEVRYVAPLLRFAATTNAVLLVAHLVPGLPLDGGRMIRAIAWGLTGNRHRGAQWAGRVGIAAAALLAAGCVLGILATGFAAGWLLGLILALTLGLQCAGAARLARLRDRLSGLLVSDLMEIAPTPLSRITSVADALGATEPQAADGAWLVEFGGRLGGIVTVDLLRAVPEEERFQTPVGQVAVRLERQHLLDGRLAAEVALSRLLRAGLPLLPVIREGALIGVLRREVVFDAVNAAGRA